MKKFSTPLACKIVFCVSLLAYVLGVLVIFFGYFNSLYANMFYMSGAALIVSGAFLNLLCIIAARLDSIFKLLCENSK